MAILQENRPYPLTPSPLNERERTWQEAQAKKDRENAASLADIGITPSEASLFNVLHYGLTVPPLDLCRRAAFRDYSVGDSLTSEKNQAALTDCLSKGWLQVVDEAVLGRLQDDVRRERLLGPVYDYPAIGGVDFTHSGAKQWFRICDRLWDGGHHKSTAYCDVVHTKSAHYFHSKSSAMAALDRFKEWESVASATGPLPIGPWRANWWRRFPEGYRINVEERMYWQGRCSEGGGSLFFNPMKLPCNLAHAKEVLDRHNLAWVEWLVLASLELAHVRRGMTHQVTESSKRFGVDLTEAECLGGLEACLRNGWLRRVDEQVSAEISSLLRADSAVMPVSFDPTKHWVEIDFSTEGALLYRMVSAEIFGRNWEEGLLVEDSYFREEHRYCATEAGLVAVRQEYAESGEIPKSTRTVPIGPWCVYWWKRFRSGYRLELTFGEASRAN